MDPLTIIASALVAGAAAGGKDAATAAVRDSYTALRNLLSRHITADAEAAIEANANDPDDVTSLEAALADTGLDENAEVRAAAEALLAKLEPDLPRSEYRIDLRGAKGVLFGTHGTQNNTFG
ncbi:hypothetical protein [Nocardia gipuzkoensis]